MDQPYVLLREQPGSCSQRGHQGPPATARGTALLGGCPGVLDLQRVTQTPACAPQASWAQRSWV